MKEKTPHIKRRTFIWLIGSAFIGIFLSIRFLYNPSMRLQNELEKLGFSVEKEELDKFWEAYLNLSKEEDYHSLRVVRTYLVEPREQNVSLFLLSSNAFENKEGESVRFVALYSAYNRPCYHPFLAKA